MTHHLAVPNKTAICFSITHIGSLETEHAVVRDEPQHVDPGDRSQLRSSILMEPELAAMSQELCWRWLAWVVEAGRSARLLFHQ